MLTDGQEAKQPEPFVYASLIFEAYSIESTQQAKTSIQISYILVDWTRLRSELASGSSLVLRMPGLVLGMKTRMYAVAMREVMLKTLNSLT